MALVHEEVYRAQDLSGIDFGRSVERVCRALVQARGVNDNTIGLSITSDGSPVAVDKAIPCVLIVAEFVSNAIRRAFSQNTPAGLTVDFREIPKDRLQLTVTDHLTEMPVSRDIDRSHSLGLQLVTALAKQLRAEVRLRATKGTEYRFRFER